MNQLLLEIKEHHNGKAGGGGGKGKKISLFTVRQSEIWVRD